MYRQSIRSQVSAARCAALCCAALFVAAAADRVGAGAAPGFAPPPAHRVSLSTASEGELASLPGVGPVLAARIVQERRTRPIRRLHDLRRVRGIGAAVVEGLAPHVEED
jgi:competence protein ComEA